MGATFSFSWKLGAISVATCRGEDVHHQLDWRGVSGRKIRAWEDHPPGSTSSKYSRPFVQSGEVAEDVSASKAVLVTSSVGLRPQAVAWDY